MAKPESSKVVTVDLTTSDDENEGADDVVFVPTHQDSSVQTDNIKTEQVTPKKEQSSNKRTMHDCPSCGCPQHEAKSSTPKKSKLGEQLPERCESEIDDLELAFSLSSEDNSEDDSANNSTITKPESAYAYTGPLKILCKIDLEDEKEQNFCFFCAELTDEIVEHLKTKHSDKDEVAFIKSLDTCRQQRKFWRFMVLSGNDKHNNSKAEFKNRGFIIPNQMLPLSNPMQKMKKCTECKGWLSKTCYKGHANHCQAAAWNEQFGSFMTKKQESKLSAKKKLTELLANEPSRVITNDLLCKAFLVEQVQKLRDSDEAKVVAKAVYLERVLRHTMTLNHELATMMKVLCCQDLHHLKTAIIATACDQETKQIDSEQAKEVAILLAKVVKVAIPLADDEIEKEHLQRLKRLLTYKHKSFLGIC